VDLAVQLNLEVARIVLAQKVALLIAAVVQEVVQDHDIAEVPRKVHLNLLKVVVQEVVQSLIIAVVVHEVMTRKKVENLTSQIVQEAQNTLQSPINPTNLVHLKVQLKLANESVEYSLILTLKGMAISRFHKSEVN
jgi:hypothetical protein